MPDKSHNLEHEVFTVLFIAGVGLATLVGIMYVKKCYVVIKGKKYGFNPAS